MNNHGRKRDVDIGLQPRQPCRLLDKARYRFRRIEQGQQGRSTRIAIGIQVMTETRQTQSSRQMMRNHLFFALPLYFIK